MSSILDIISSYIIGGTLLIIALTMLDTTSKHFLAHGDDLIVQQNLTGITLTLEHDLKKMGFGVAETQHVLISADSTNLKFLGDLDRNGSIDTVEYFVGTVTELQNTPNPDDRFLYRRINSTPTAGAKTGIVSDFYFDYLDQDGNILDTSIPENIDAVKMIRITLQVENAEVYGSNLNPQKQEYRTAFWQQTRLVSRNLRR